MRIFVNGLTFEQDSYFSFLNKCITSLANGSSDGIWHPGLNTRKPGGTMSPIDVVDEYGLADVCFGVCCGGEVDDFSVVVVVFNDAFNVEDDVDDMDSDEKDEDGSDDSGDIGDGNGDDDGNESDVDKKVFVTIG